MFYKRKLPEQLVRFASEEGKKLLREAWDWGMAESYFPLAEYYVTQDLPSSCGLSSLSMSLNSLDIDPGRQWKGVWRFFSEYNMEGVNSDLLKQTTLDQLLHIACQNKADGMLFHAPAQSYKEVGRTFDENLFRTAVVACCRREGMTLLLNYQRNILGQTGTGHYSPVAAYHSGSDRALVMDVARFKYPPYWVSIPQLYQSMVTLDGSKPRGFLVISKKLNNQASLCTMVDDFKGQVFCKDHLTTLLQQAERGTNLMVNGMVFQYYYEVEVRGMNEGGVVQEDESRIEMMAKKMQIRDVVLQQLRSGLSQNMTKQSSNHKKLLKRIFFGMWWGY